MIYYVKPDRNGNQTVVKIDDDQFVMFVTDPANTDYQQYLKWVEEGNVAQPWNPEENK